MIDEERAYFANRAAEEAEAAASATERQDVEAASAHRALQRHYLERASTVGRESETAD